MFGVFVNLEKTFDRLPREELCYFMREARKGLNTTMMKVLFIGFIDFGRK